VGGVGGAVPMSLLRITPNFYEYEFACKDGTPYPVEWFEERLRPLCETLEVIREAAGNRAIRVTSGYRTLAYNRSIGSSDGSQHVQGRAADIQHPVLTAGALHTLVMKLYKAGKLPHLGGVGQYITFTHVDVRPRPADGHLAQWLGTRVRIG
jgi:hypothetical protein